MIDFFLDFSDSITESDTDTDGPSAIFNYGYLAMASFSIEIIITSEILQYFFFQFWFCSNFNILLLFYS